MASISDQGSLRIISRSDSNSSYGHISRPSQEASTLLSPVQLHHDSSVQERDIPTSVKYVEDKNDPQFTSFHGVRHWKTVGMILGFLFAGKSTHARRTPLTCVTLLSALGHYLFFKNLDRKLTNTSYLTQSQTSAVSILLMTIFKAALTASIGICFAQHLWLVLRRNAIPLEAIEKLFILRTNILALCDLRSTRRAPLLILMALFLWCLGLATIYPPGALIVIFEAYTFTENPNLSVMNPPIPYDLDFAGNKSFPTLGFDGFGNRLATYMTHNNVTSSVEPSARMLAY
jgi:hypothetical protein